MPAFEMAFQQRVDIDDVKNWNRFTVRWWLLAGTPVWFWYSGGVLILWWGSSTRVGFCYSGGVLVPEWGSVTLVGLSHSGGVLVLRLGFWYSGGVLVLRLGFWCSGGVLVPWWVSRTGAGFWYSGGVLVLGFGSGTYFGRSSSYHGCVGVVNMSWSHGASQRLCVGLNYFFSRNVDNIIILGYRASINHSRRRIHIIDCDKFASMHEQFLRKLCACVIF